MHYLSSVTSAYVQMAWFITFECEQQSVSFPALFIENQGVIEKLEESRRTMKFWPGMLKTIAHTPI